MKQPIQKIYLLVSVETELPEELEIVTFMAKVPVTNIFPEIFDEKEIDFSFRGWREGEKFLIHGIGGTLKEGKVTHWFKEKDLKDVIEFNNSVIKLFK